MFIWMRNVYVCVYVLLYYKYIIRGMKGKIISKIIKTGQFFDILLISFSSHYTSTTDMLINNKE